MQAIEVLYRLMGAKEANRWIPIPFKRMSPTIFETAEGVEFCLENHIIDVSYSEQLDVDEFIEHEGEMEVYISCLVEPDEFKPNVLTLITVGTSDNFDDEIDQYHIPFDASPKEFWTAVKDALESAEEYLRDWEVDHRIDEDEMDW